MKDINIQDIVIKPFLTEPEVAAYLGLSKRQIQELRTKGTDKGRMPYIRVGGSLRYHRKEVDEFMLKHEVDTSIYK